MCAVSNRASWKSAVWPLRSRTTNTGICSAIDAALLRYTATLTAGAIEVALALERFEEEGFVGFDNAAKMLGSMVSDGGQEALAPAPGDVLADSALCCRRLH
ncbi:hypothetical protein JHS3_09600 [Jeongeupia sp. HS-3]|nr:hypothetical protein JHS3_09600 [Jeongeupia sp. HS-3]